MTAHLISVLGKPRKLDSGDRSYQTATYRFPDGTTHTSTSFGLALGRWFVEAKRQRLDRVLWLGTSQSEWGSLLQTVLGDGVAEEELYFELYDAQETTQAKADQVAEILSRATGQTHTCRIIPSCKDLAEQQVFVETLTGELQPKDQVLLDLTHGLRNQSLMLAQSALMLECAYDVRIEGLYYGGLEIPREPGEPAPAVDLTGLLEQARLAQALHAFQQSGDVRMLLPHLREGGFRRQIENLGHAVAIHNYSEARNLATSALAALPGAGTGVMEPVIRRTLEAFKARSLAESQYQQAEAWLDRKDYLRATLQLFEGAITRVCQRKGWDITDPVERIKQAGQSLRSLHDDDWKALEFLRNQMAHGLASDWHGLMRTAKNPIELEKLLRRLLTTIPALADRA